MTVGVLGRFLQVRGLTGASVVVVICIVCALVQVGLGVEQVNSVDAFAEQRLLGQHCQMVARVELVREANVSPVVDVGISVADEVKAVNAVVEFEIARHLLALLRAEVVERKVNMLH